MKIFSIPAWLLLLSGICLFSCNDDSLPTGSINGTVLDNQGNPLPDVEVRAVSQDGLYGPVVTTTNQNGTYKLSGLGAGDWKVYARQEVDYKGVVYSLRMGMPAASDYIAFNPVEAPTVKNFVWQLSGEIPDLSRSASTPGGYFGGVVQCVIFPTPPNPLPEGTVITLTFTPVAGAVRLDGSAAETIQKSFTIEDGDLYGYYVFDVPQSEYRVTAKSNKDGVESTVLINQESLLDPFGAAVDNFYFRRDPMYTTSHESGLKAAELYLKLQ